MTSASHEMDTAAIRDRSRLRLSAQTFEDIIPHTSRVSDVPLREAAMKREDYVRRTCP